MIAIIFQVLGFLISFAFNALVYTYAVITMLIDLMSRPFQALANKIKEFFAKKIPIPDKLNSKFRAVNGFAPFVLLMAAIVFSVVAFVISSFAWDKNDNYLTYMVYNTTLGSVTGFLSEGLPFTPATLVAIAFSGMLLPMCMNAHNRENKKAPIYIRIPCYVVYLVTSSIVAMMLSEVFQVVGEWGYQSILALYHGLGESIFLSILKIIALIPLCYVALLLCMITIKTYAECIVFGFLGVVVLFLAGFLIQLIPESYAVLAEALTIILVLASFFGLDVLQGKAVGKLEEVINEKDKKNKGNSDDKNSEDENGEEVEDSVEDNVEDNVVVQ